MKIRRSTRVPCRIYCAGRTPMWSFLVVLLPYMLGCSAALPDIELGAPVPVDAESTGVMIMVSPAQFQHEWSWLFLDVEYSLGVDGNGEVQYLSTSSRRVATSEGVRVGQAFANLQKVEGVEIGRWPGWGYVAELPSGWKAAFFIGQTMTDREPRPEDKVDLLFLGTVAGY